MSNSKSKKVLSLILSFVMCLTMIPSFLSVSYAVGPEFTVSSTLSADHKAVHIRVEMNGANDFTAGTFKITFNPNELTHEDAQTIPTSAANQNAVNISSSGEILVSVTTDFNATFDNDTLTLLDEDFNTANARKAAITVSTVASSFDDVRKDVATKNFDVTIHGEKTFTKDPVDPTCKNGGYEGDVYCECGVYIGRGREYARLPHTPSAAVEENRIAPTCSKEGSFDEVVYCSVCGDEISRETKKIEKLPHTEAIDPAVAPTCKEFGKTEGSHCSVCGEIIKPQTVVDKTPHTPSAAVEENRIAPTCSKEGSFDEVVYCSVCGDEISRETKKIEKLPHTEAIDPAVAPTCKEFGKTEGSHCSVCGEIIKPQLSVGKLAHVGEIQNEKAANCISKGYKGDTVCKNCGELLKKGKEINKDTGNHEHKTVVNAKAATCTQDGFTGNTICADCKRTFVKGKTIPKLGHNYVAGKCTRCGEAEPEKPQYVLGDVNGDGKITPPDARLALRISAKLETKYTEQMFKAADIDGNGKVSATDARKILRFTAKLDKVLK